MSTEIIDKSGELIAELRQNEWKVTPSPKTWDRNYTEDTLEVIDARGKVILQVKALPDRIQLQGEWWGKGGTGLRLIKDTQQGGAYMLLLSSTYNPDEPHIEPLFEYPSERHFGQLKPKP